MTRDGQISLFRVRGEEEIQDEGGTPEGGAPEPSGKASPGPPVGPSGKDASPVEDPEALAPGLRPETALSVSEVNAAARELLEDRFPEIWVSGEIANWRRVGSGHCYFSLRDESAQLSCVMWRSDARRLPTDPEEGMEVAARGQISLYEARGTYQLKVRALEAVGEGLWRLAFERLKKKLAAEGLLDDARKKRLPRVPGTVGVVTSRTGAALRDVVTVIRRRAPWTRVLVSHCRVQGQEAAPEIVEALERLERFGGVDVIILTRGGGSVEDLWAFNEEAVARAVVDCPIPVISAVGHEVDVTIADLVADARAPTPSAAGELAVPDAAALRARVRSLAEGLVAGLRDRTRRGRERARRGAERLTAGMRRQMERRRNRLDNLSGRLDALSPLGILRRGYAVARDPDGRVLSRGKDFGEGDAIGLRVLDAEVACTVDAVETRDPPTGPTGGGGGAEDGSTDEETDG